jgi:acetoacetyl-CoA synthetase
VVHGDPTQSLWPGEIQAVSLGMAVDVFDADRDEPYSIKETGNPGELVCTRPFPSQPVTFWGSDGMERYRKSYFERFGNNFWCQGDFVAITKDTTGILMLGRS